MQVNTKQEDGLRRNTVGGEKNYEENNGTQTHTGYEQEK